MRLTPFFTVSLALHAGVLVYPVAFHGWKQEQPIAVAILPIELDGGGGSPDGGPAGEPKRTRHRPASKAAFADLVMAVTEEASESVPDSSAVEVAANINESNVALSTATAGADVRETAGGSGSTGRGPGGNGFGSVGNGSGSGTGHGTSQGAAGFTQARYSDTPKPIYPEIARRQGHEGRVLLRVLVDDQGRTKSVEINRSSGSDALDHAATQAIKLWRFYPARAGDKPVESWVGIPIDFRLTDSKN